MRFSQQRGATFHELINLRGENFNVIPVSKKVIEYSAAIVPRPLRLG